MILRIDELIAELTQVRNSLSPNNNNVEVFIDDADTGWHMRIANFRWSTKYPNRLLLEGEGYASCAAE